MSDYIPQEPVNRAILAIPPSRLRDIVAHITTASRQRGMLYRDDDGRAKIIHVMLRPWILTRAQLALYQRLSLHIRSALSHVWELYLHDPRVRAILPLSETEESWLREAYHDRGAHRYTILGRLDSNAVYDRPTWRRDLRFLEPNTVGIGGAHYAPVAQSLLADEIIPELQRRLRLRLRPAPDPRALLVREFALLLNGRLPRAWHLVLLENQDYKGGTDEFASLAVYFNRQGIRTSVADPRQLRLRGGRVTLRGRPVDVLYRDCEMKEFIEMEQGGVPLTALRQMIRRHRMVSSITAEFDHKSVWEIFTESAFARYFTPTQRAIFRRYFLWTRLFREARVTDPSGRAVDVVAYARRQQSRLVLKPNHAYGGEGVTIGALVSRRTWERTITRALSGKESYVVQARAHIAEDVFPIVASDGRAHLVKRHVVSGFFVTTSGISSIGRFCGDQVVNVSRGGGIVAVFQTA